jgi:hypothetical protein
VTFEPPGARTTSGFSAQLGDIFSRNATCTIVPRSTTREPAASSACCSGTKRGAFSIPWSPKIAIVVASR